MIFGAPGIEKIDFWCSGVLRGRGGRDRGPNGKTPGTILAKTPPNLLKKPWFWGGEALGGTADAGNPGPPKALKSKKITKTLKLKLLVNSRKHD